jgi:hypothetical protein
MAQNIYPYHCYEIKLKFLDILESYRGPIWIVQGELSYGENNEFVNYTILEINPITFEVKSDRLNVNLANSLESTIFSLAQYKEKSLSIGTVWDEIDSYFTNVIPLEIKREQIMELEFRGITTDENTTISTSVLGYDIITESVVNISETYSFPIKSHMFSPHQIFPEPKELYYYELLNYTWDDSLNQCVDELGNEY